ncbi:hypothetical protein HS088_TW04G00214 [Tripterygium wilfordii]|uniref:Uncharacterized protein n=1 Tax=Tripterygium wilfordii TaxID=458696 RepID=A0A7J7DPF0_TRIWF|nr:hypothetical protein HS088_TW04G00214 [Tripterygium wilfordii]
MASSSVAQLMISCSAQKPSLSTNFDHLIKSSIPSSTSLRAPVSGELVIMGVNATKPFLEVGVISSTFKHIPGSKFEYILLPKQFWTSKLNNLYPFLIS